MSSGCGDVLSLADLQTAKKHQIFEAEVITGRSGGVAGGAGIDYATNQVTGQTQKTLPAILRDAGFSPVSWDFSTGGTLTVDDRDKVVYDPVSKTWYSYAGTLPVTVPASFNPVGNADWKPQTDPDLRSDLETMFSNGSFNSEVNYKIGLPSDVDGAVFRTLQSKLDDTVDIRDFGAIPGDAAACTAAIKAAIAYIKTRYRGVGTIYISNSKESNTPYLFNETILLDSQGLRIIGDSRWGSNIQTTAGVDPAIKVTGSSCEVSNIYLTTAEGVTGLHLQNGNNFSSDNLVVKIAAIGVLHEKNNSSWIRNFLAESCGVGYTMRPSGASDCNGSYIHGRSYNCEIGFEITSGANGTQHPGMNTIYYSCEGNVIGFKETGGRYNYLNIYSESNRKVSTQGNTNANFSTIGRPNIWVAQNPDNDENVIKGSAVGFYSRGGQVYQKVSGYERNIVTRTIQTGDLGDPSAGIYVVTNGTSTTHQLTLGFLPYLRPGQEVTIISRNTANGWNIRQAGGVILYGAVVDGTLFGAYVASGKADILKVTKINDTMAITEYIRGA